VIPDYDELPSNENGDEAAFVARYEAAIELANLVQTGLVIDATENDGWSPEQVTEDELNACSSRRWCRSFPVRVPTARCRLSGASMLPWW
jgi:hypothetical protein